MHIITERLELKPIQPESLESLTDLLTDTIVTKTYMVPDFPSREEARKLSQRLIDMSYQEERRVAGIYFGDTLIGILNQTDADGDRIELGYALLPQSHNRGYATEALRGAIAYCFDHGFREVTAGAFQENIPSIRVMVKCGMTKTALHEQVFYRGKDHECVYYSITKEDSYAV